MVNQARAGGSAARRLGWQRAKARPTLARPATVWDDVLTMPVEITAPDRESARALLGDAVSHFRAELVETAGSATIVRLRPTSTVAAGWVFELLALVERWLEAHNLKVVNVHHGSRNYVITVPHPDVQREGNPGPAAAA